VARVVKADAPSAYACTQYEPNIPVLAAGRAVEVDDNLEAVVARPGDGLLEIRQLALAVRLAAGDIERPEADLQRPPSAPRPGPSAHCTYGNADVVKPGSSDRGKVRLGDPRVPVVREDRLRGGLVLERAERPLVDYVRVSTRLSLAKIRCSPTPLGAASKMLGVIHG
jgi:hypothetical protein